MNKFVSLTLLAGALAAPSVHAAFQAQVGLPGSYGPWSFSVGEVAIIPNAELASVVSSAGGYSSAALNSYPTGAIPSFCLERNEGFDTGTTYNVGLSSGAINGGLTGGNPDKISLATAWLYSEFAKGTLADYDYTNAGTDYDPGFLENPNLVGRKGAAGLLQEAIWYFEGESFITLRQGAEFGSNPFVTLAQNHFSGTTELNDANGAYGVMVMNMTRVSNGDLKQDFLVVVPEPSTYLAGALLGLPFVVGAIRRARRTA